LGGLDGLAAAPRIVGPETTGFEEVAEYVAALDVADLDAIAHHLYGVDQSNLDLDALSELGQLGEEYERPLFQSEMYADPLTTAVLLHAALAVEGASVFVHNGFVSPPGDFESDDGSLVKLTEDDFVVGDTRHVMGHYAAHVEPGWRRVAADSDTDDLYASAWISPAADRLVIVLTNPSDAVVAVDLDTGGAVPEDTTVSRTVLGGVERSAQLGELSPEGVVVLPPESLVTVTLER